MNEEPQAPIWKDDPDNSTLLVGPEALPVTVYVERWPRRPEWWSVSVCADEGSQAFPIHGSGHAAPGHPSREAAKAAGLEALSTWLRTVAEQTSAAMAAL